MLKWRCMECGDLVSPGTETHCGKPTDHEEVCEACGEPYYVGSDACLTATRSALAAANQQIEWLETARRDVGDTAFKAMREAFDALAAERQRADAAERELASRWVPLKATSPSGRAMLACRCCGRTSVTPDKSCKTIGDPDETWKCSEWKPPVRAALRGEGGSET